MEGITGAFGWLTDPAHWQGANGIPTRFVEHVELAGLDGIPAEIRESADGMGYSGRQRLLAVELPLALPVIIAGLRVATVTTVGLVMVTAVIGEGGLGQLMLRGFNRQFPTMIYVGFVLIIVIALVLDLLLQLVQRLLTPWARGGV